MNRAERRQIARSMGLHRSPGKRGRRPTFHEKAEAVAGMMAPQVVTNQQGPQPVPVHGRRVEPGPGGLSVVRYDPVVQPEAP